MIHPDLCEICGRVDPHLVDGLCTVCAGRSTTITRDRLLTVLSRHVGAASGVTITALVEELVAPFPVVAPERHSLERSVRELVVQLRLQGHHICSHPSTGYYMAQTADELDGACQFLYERAMTSLAQVAAMKRVSLPDLRGQLHLPT